MEPWLSWIIVVAFTGAAYLYYTQTNQPGGQRGRSIVQRATTSTKDTLQWAESETKSKLAAKPTKAKAPRKSVKKAVQEVGDKAGAYLSGASSAAGADADDDLSPVASPGPDATPAVKAPSGKDVSDMLEPKTAGPGVLKISASEKPARPSKPQQLRAEPVQETKKQRQNKKKVEEAKAQREADEKQRRALEEKQRRAAREARGEPARNGLQSAQAPSSSPWTNGRSSAAPKTAPANSNQLLDTFEHDVASIASSSEAATNGTAPSTDSMENSGQWTNLPSEEEQLRIAMQDSAWSVAGKGKKQRKTRPVGGDQEGSDSAVPMESPVVKPTPPPVPTKKAENVQSRRYEVLSPPGPEHSHPLDSDWPVV
ncbi:hypothetical protein BDV95DRAFT_608590 [Massariosphaeria phaeospora]|uniref:Uncharacterized protein n=1 Tax=Massariosphaeria phaeospora TaxID=100035 RepID=A0A7C8M6B1_9PLEO|nr:hypothetical protein BDV95DRAFT_608590 [Massariosphaeria phaeospora]